MSINSMTDLLIQRHRLAAKITRKEKRIRVLEHELLDLRGDKLTVDAAIAKLRKDPSNG
jgi:hypothetical protein